MESKAGFFSWLISITPSNCEVSIPCLPRHMTLANHVYFRSLFMLELRTPHTIPSRKWKKIQKNRFLKKSLKRKTDGVQPHGGLLEDSRIPVGAPFRAPHLSEIGSTKKRIIPSSIRHRLDQLLLPKRSDGFPLFLRVPGSINSPLFPYNRGWETQPNSRGL